MLFYGALTAKSSAYRYRTWELTYIAVIDFFDVLGQRGHACLKGLEIIRILPSIHDMYDWGFR